MNDQPPEEDLVAHTQRMEITFHLGIGGVPILQRPSDNAARLFGARGAVTQGGLQ